jgi:type VI secretion system secreted protein VgrG
MPLWELPTQHMLSGFKSKEIGATRNNYLIMNDTKGEIQAQLGSEHMSSQLNLGYLTRIPSPSGRQDYRGQGFEVRTDAWGAIRAAKGMMLSTHSRADGSSHIKDLSEILSALKGAHSQHKAFAELAIDHKADERALDQTAQTALKSQNEDIAGSQGDADKFPELTEPHLIIGSPAGVEFVTPQSTHIATGQHIAITSHADTSISAKRIAGSVARGISLFTQTIGQKWFAAKGKVEIQAQNDRLDMIAEKVFKIISTKGSIELAAAEEILATAGGSYIKINKSGIEHGTPMDWKVWAGSHGKPSAKSLPYQLPNPIKKECMKEAAEIGSAYVLRP